MKLDQILEAVKSKRLVVVYGGRFQPFHKGHFDTYKWLCKKFNPENVWIATSNSTNFNPSRGKISPFTFKEKKEIMVSLYDINPRRIIQCKNPTFSPVEIFALYKGFPIVFVAAVGKKDEDRYKSGTFFKPLPRPFELKNVEMLETVEESSGYYVDVPMMSGEISGTEIRDAIKIARGDDREAAFKKYFGRYDSVIDSLFIAKLKDVQGEAE